MSRIGATISGFERFLLDHLALSERASIEGAIRLATGSKVLTPADDPAAFLQISALEHRLNVVNQTKANVDAAATVGSQTQLGLDKLRTQLTTIRDALRLDENQALGGTGRAAAQATIDGAIRQINEIADTPISGRRFLNGSVNYRFAGRNYDQIKDVQVYAPGQTRFEGTVTAAATRAAAVYVGKNGKVDSGDASFTLTGLRGSAQFSVSGGEKLDDVADRVNEQSHQTGITARAKGNQLVFTSVDYGDDATVRITPLQGDFTAALQTPGRDAQVTINGRPIGAAQVQGNRVTYADNGTHLVFEFQPGFSGTFDTIHVQDEDVARFALSTEIHRAATFNLPDVSASSLGGVSGRLSDLASGGALAGLGQNTSQALRVVDEALAQLTLVEARVDSFADITVASAASLLSGFEADLRDFLEQTNGVDQEEESLLLVKNQSLVGTTVAALSLLQEQRASQLGLLRRIAGI